MRHSLRSFFSRDKRRDRSCRLLALLFLLFSTATGTAHAQQATGLVTGRITDAETGTPLPGASVFIEEVSRGAATDTDGRFVLTLVDYYFDSNSRVYFNGIFTQLRDLEYQPNVINIIEDGAVEFEHKDRLETARTISLSAGGEHVLGGGVGLDYRVGWVRSQEDTPIENELLFLHEGVTFDPEISDPDDIRANPSSLEPLAFDVLVDEEKLVRNTNVVAEASLTLPYRFNESVTGSFEFGGQFRNKNAGQEVSVVEYGLADGAEDIVLGRDIGSPFSVEGYVPGRYPFPGSVVRTGAIRDLQEEFAGRLGPGERDLEADTEDYDILERTYAAYVMTELNPTARLMILPGVRFERTEIEADGKQFDADTGTLSPSTEDNAYNQLFPMLHVRYEVTPRTNLRAAATRTLARPNYFFLVPFRIQEDGEAELGNPDLDPTTSFNYDLMLAHYSRRIGVLSAGVFAKQLTGPIFTFTGTDEAGVEFSQPRNASTGRILGLELNLTQQLTFLPGALGGLGLYANYTFTDSQAERFNAQKTRLPGQSDHVYNLALSYERAGFSGQISANFASEYILELGGNPLDHEVVDDHFQLDFSASYRVTPGVSTYLEIVNLTGAPYRVYKGRPIRPIQQEYYATWGRIGVRYRM